MQKQRRFALRPTRLLPLMLLIGCAHDSTLYVPPDHQPAIPPLPAQARQVDSPKFSASAQKSIEKWLQLLTEPSSPVEPVKPHTKP